MSEIVQFASQEGLNFDYKQVCDVRLAVQAVLKDFAKRFSLLAKVCTAYTVQKDLQSKLGGNELLLQVWCCLCSAFWTEGCTSMGQIVAACTSRLQGLGES